ncbi:aminotransferase class IV family protein [Lysobacter sp. Root604]|uniref:aminotransferase class IV family protein n=1 Tax=Lysobacter sp. Root604 TaxID=1736568 RepID=UPI0006FBC904|nr:aminotransferase class IV family protein [Lysobacter sp. Root604]KRA20904.1 branched-chain amino acid aminotransferase [Lysobacter sp. Root604]
MLTASPTYVTQRNGQDANAETLAPLAFAGHAHFTAMQVRDRKIRGLDLHLDRLRAASMQMYGHALPDERICAYLRSAIEAGPADLSLTATVYSPAGEFVVAGPGIEPEILIRTSPAATGPAGPLSLATFDYERPLPNVKHVGEVAKTHYLRAAVAQGFDDAAFVDRHGRLSEASIWNLVFWDGEAVVWPIADMLIGTTMGIVRRQLERLGVAQRAQEVRLTDLACMAGAAVMNSWTPGIAVSALDQANLSASPALMRTLHRAYEMEPPQDLDLSKATRVESR